jgi:glutamate synthase domain-containing protein 1
VCHARCVRCAVLCTGEINTLQGNLNWVASRQAELEHPIWSGREEQLLPLCNAAGEAGWL